MYDLLTGPALWFTFIIFLGGMFVRMIFLFRLSRKKDRVFYNHVSFSWGLKSILHWLVPWASASMRLACALGECLHAQSTVFHIHGIRLSFNTAGSPPFSECA
jgi:hypothetical protein